jgi:hypothetical protein
MCKYSLECSCPMDSSYSTCLRGLLESLYNRYTIVVQLLY